MAAKITIIFFESDRLVCLTLPEIHLSRSFPTQPLPKKIFYFFLSDTRELPPTLAELFLTPLEQLIGMEALSADVVPPQLNKCTPVFSRRNRSNAIPNRKKT